MRILTRAVIAVLVLALLYATAAYVSIVHGTRYAPGFSDAKFQTITRRMPQRDVRRILGEPVSAERHESRQYRVKLMTGKTVPVLVTYDKRGYILSADDTAKSRGIGRGMYKRDAELALHTTKSSSAGFRDYWHYTQPRLLANEWNLRDVEFDESGRVARVESYRMY